MKKIVLGAVVLAASFGEGMAMGELLSAAASAATSIMKRTIEGTTEIDNHYTFLESLKDQSTISPDQIKGSLLDQAIPKSSLRLTTPSEILNQEITLVLGGKKVVCSIRHFSLTHHLVPVQDYPVETLLTSGVSYIIPSILSTPILVAAAAFGSAYIGYRAYTDGTISQIMKNTHHQPKKDDDTDDKGTEAPSTADLILHRLGVGNRLSDIMGENPLAAPFISAAHPRILIYKGRLRDGYIPGKEIKYRILLEPIAYVN